MTNRPRSKNLDGRTAVAVLATITALGGGMALAASPQRASTSGYSVRALVSEAEADLAAGHPGRAILQYERAKLTAPRSPAVSSGLARARATANLPLPTPSLPERALGMAGADAWGWIGMSGLILAAMAVVAAAWGLLRRRGFLVLVAAASVASLGLVAARQVSPPPNRAVVVSSDVVARIAPFANADEAFATREGSEVTVERTHDSYSLIATPDGRGWVPTASIETILPPATHNS